MTICTPHSYGGPKECPYCRIAELETQHDAVSNEWRKAEARIAELEAQLRDSKGDLAPIVALQNQRATLETRITRAVAELENHVLPLCSEEGEIEHAAKRALEALR